MGKTNGRLFASLPVAEAPRQSSPNWSEALFPPTLSSLNFLLLSAPVVVDADLDDALDTDQVHILALSAVKGLSGRCSVTDRGTVGASLAPWCHCGFGKISALQSAKC
jgi:hypothetical protein